MVTQTNSTVTAQDLVDAHLYETEDAVIRDALDALLRERPDLRLRVAMHRYQTEDMSLGYAATLAGVSWASMRGALHSAGVPLRLGPRTIEEALEEVRVLQKRRSQRGQSSGDSAPTL